MITTDMDLHFPVGTNWRSVAGRVCYRPDWDAKRPYITYDRKGDAQLHFMSLSNAQLYLGRRVKNWIRS